MSSWWPRRLTPILSKSSDLTLRSCWPLTWLFKKSWRYGSMELSRPENKHCLDETMLHNIVLSKRTCKTKRNTLITNIEYGWWWWMKIALTILTNKSVEIWDVQTFSMSDWQTNYLTSHWKKVHVLVLILSFKLKALMILYRRHFWEHPTRFQARLR